MIVTNDKPSRKRLRAAAKQLMDVAVGDMVRRSHHRGVGIVEEVKDGWARVVWKDGQRTDHPLATLRKIPAGGSNFDRRMP